MVLPFTAIHTIISIHSKAQLPQQTATTVCPNNSNMIDDFMSPSITEPIRKPTSPTEIATIAAGCFWSIENHFLNLDGVVETAVGYTGGHTQNPTYQDVCHSNTAHAEAIQIKFLPACITYEQILQHFWHLHDPTQKDRQGPDVGSQYRSAIFYHSAQQEAIARQSLQTLQSKLSKKIVTEIISADIFWLAEKYHQQYVLKKQTTR